jgi:hypothetical protein
MTEVAIPADMVDTLSHLIGGIDELMYGQNRLHVSKVAVEIAACHDDGDEVLGVVYSDDGGALFFKPGYDLDFRGFTDDDNTPPPAPLPRRDLLDERYPPVGDLAPYDHEKDVLAWH